MLYDFDVVTVIRTLMSYSIFGKSINFSNFASIKY